MKKSHSNLSKNEPGCMCKEGWCVGLRQQGASLREGWGNCLKYLKRGWNRKEGSGNKNFKKRGQAGLMGGCLKKGKWLEPLYVYIYIHSCPFLCIITFIMFIYFLKTVQSFYIIFSQMFLVILEQSLIQKASQFKDHC